MSDSTASISPDDLGSLRHVAEVSLANGGVSGVLRHSTVLALLNRMERAEAELERMTSGASPCAWCSDRSRGQARHNDGVFYPSCGQVGHGDEWVPIVAAAPSITD